MISIPCLVHRTVLKQDIDQLEFTKMSELIDRSKNFERILDLDIDKELLIKELESKLNVISNEFEIERIQLKDQINLVQEKYLTVNKELESNNSTVKYLYDTNKKLENNIVKLREEHQDEIEEKNTFIAELEKTVEARENELDDLESDLQEQIDDLKDENTEFQNKLKIYKNKIKEYKHEINCKENEIHNLKSEREFNAEEVEQKTETNQDNISELQRQNELYLKENKELIETKLKHMKTIDDLNYLKESNNFWRLECDRLQVQVKDIKKLKNEIKEKQLESNKLRKVLTQWEIFEQQLQKSPNEIISEWRSFETERAFLNNQLSEANAKNSKANEEYKNLKDENNKNLENIKQLEGELNSSRLTNVTERKEKKLLSHEASMLRTQAEEMFGMLQNTINNKFPEVESKLKSIEEDTKQSEALIQSYKEEIESIKKEYESLESTEFTSTKKRKLEESVEPTILKEEKVVDNSKKLELMKAKEKIEVLETKLAKLKEFQDQEEQTKPERDVDISNVATQTMMSKNRELLRSISNMNNNNNNNSPVPRHIFDTLYSELKEMERKLIQKMNEITELKQKNSTP
ncbi:hypothetical protein Kpol_1033p33 [Vanderwaltozyma polyspora DSM 70294]|uniref:Uncharacterized protein n=1 Tax=Vanderwaltozyma polyspora (strain ATCC 22028 / DSM 70294 / BCRC 21397 / CBS 2163 / NBRC 10782 / NRRL Y-8283 / UCD 57-17) TaxID=436907 RepID=A7TJ29_VANPO|nr:uncharacterized protein Kpol_1033p33 [Vanderwaltozyma polyspora DSM 70294]EDO17728.1 hypothetical protein Kpol_1033p33 [Vanderwaltozyma polyspora DSM 70294]